jgi:hypothetical protein
MMTVGTANETRKGKTMTTAEAIKIAKTELNRRNRILAPQSEARVEFPEYNSCRAVQQIARVYWPATVNMRDVVLCHVIQ